MGETLRDGGFRRSWRSAQIDGTRVDWGQGEKQQAERKDDDEQDAHRFRIPLEEMTHRGRLSYAHPSRP